jgi:hypothetical protein
MDGKYEEHKYRAQAIERGPMPEPKGSLGFAGMLGSCI